ncbi:uncharacterized protein VP01_3544g1, partial [Puccinia sorghi]
MTGVFSPRDLRHCAERYYCFERLEKVNCRLRLVGERLKGSMDVSELVIGIECYLSVTVAEIQHKGVSNDSLRLKVLRHSPVPVTGRVSNKKLTSFFFVRYQKQGRNRDEVKISRNEKTEKNKLFRRQEHLIEVKDKEIRAASPDKDRELMNREKKGVKEWLMFSLREVRWSVEVERRLRFCGCSCGLHSRKKYWIAILDDIFDWFNRSGLCEYIRYHFLSFDKSNFDVACFDLLTNSFEFLSLSFNPLLLIRWFALIFFFFLPKIFADSPPNHTTLNIWKGERENENHTAVESMHATFESSRSINLFGLKYSSTVVWYSIKSIKNKRIHQANCIGCSLHKSVLILLSYRVLCKSGTIVKTKNVCFLKGTNLSIIQNSNDVPDQVWWKINSTILKILKMTQIFNEILLHTNHYLQNQSNQLVENFKTDLPSDLHIFMDFIITIEAIGTEMNYIERHKFWDDHYDEPVNALDKTCLKKALYGLKQAPKNCESQCDPFLYVCENGQFFIFFHIEDLVLVGFGNDFKKKIAEKFSNSACHPPNNLLGMKIEKEGNKIFLLKPQNIAHGLKEEASDKDHAKLRQLNINYRSAIEHMNYIASNTCPELSFAISKELAISDSPLKRPNQKNLFPSTATQLGETTQILKNLKADICLDHLAHGTVATKGVSLTFLKRKSILCFNHFMRVSKPSEESPRETEVKIHLKMMLLIKQSNGITIEFFGTGKVPDVGRPAKFKINGFEMMAINIRNQSPSKINLTPHQMKDQLNTYKDKYKK